MKTMINRLVMLLGMAFVIAMPAGAQELIFPDDSCNLNGLSKIKDDAKRSAVFNKRLANNGKGNGGEALDVVVLLDQYNPEENNFDLALTCIKTADEDTGGTVSLGFSWGGVWDPDFGTTEEADPN